MRFFQKKLKQDSGDSDEDHIPLLELLKANSKIDILTEMQCMVVIERMDTIPDGTQKLNSEQKSEKVNEKAEQDEKEEEEQQQEGGSGGGVEEHEEMVESKSCDVIQEEDEDVKPLDLTTCVRQVDDSDIVLISDTEEPPIIISDSEGETDAELIESTQDGQQMVSNLILILVEDLHLPLKLLFICQRINKKIKRNVLSTMSTTN